MTAILKVDTIQDTSGNNIINESSDTITIGASGDTISIPSGATITNSGTATGFGANTPSFFAQSASFQSIPNTTNTQIVFGTEVIDTASAFASNTFTVPSGEGGTYFLYAQAGQQGWSTNRFLILLRKNGSTGIGTGELVSSAAQYPTVSTSIIAVLSAGDTVDVTIYQDTGSSQNISTNNRTMFMGFKLI